MHPKQIRIYVDPICTFKLHHALVLYANLRRFLVHFIGHHNANGTFFVNNIQ
jgi:hypothetical protein